jgi:hypothetical protein
MFCRGCGPGAGRRGEGERSARRRRLGTDDKWPSPLTKTGGGSPFQNLTLRKKISAVPRGTSPRTAHRGGEGAAGVRGTVWRARASVCAKNVNTRARERTRTLLGDDRVALGRQDVELRHGRHGGRVCCRGFGATRPGRGSLPLEGRGESARTTFVPVAAASRGQPLACTHWATSTPPAPHSLPGGAPSTLCPTARGVTYPLHEDTQFLTGKLGLSTWAATAKASSAATMSGCFLARSVVSPRSLLRS